jgi:hypothetical protein
MTINLVSPSLVGTIADLKTFDGAKLFDQHLFLVSNLNGALASFRWTTGLAGTGDDQLLVTPTTGAGSGRFLRADPFVSLKLPYTATATNNTTLITIPTGLRFGVIKTGLEIGTQFTGIDTGSIGLDSNISLNAGGLGTIVGNTGSAAGTFNGVQGADVTTPIRSMMKAADVFRHNVLVAGYTGGTGFWHVMGALFQT